MSERPLDIGPGFWELFRLPDRRPWCDAPVPRAITARTRVKRWVLSVATEGPTTYTPVVAWHPCRQCHKCRYIRITHWRNRMKCEIDKSERTWLVTLTLSAKARADMDRTVRAEQSEELRSHGIDHEAADLFKDRSFLMLIWVRDYLKRLRYHFETHGGIKLRYAAVTEPHQDGYPHVHMLVHTTTAVTHRLLRKARWGHGFVDAKLADGETATYLVKYLNKTGSKVRASQAYGSAPDRGAADIIEDIPNLVSQGEADDTTSLTKASPNLAARVPAESSDPNPTAGDRKRAKSANGVKQNGRSIAKASAPEGLSEPDE